jgi:hypothetical protein
MEGQGMAYLRIARFRERSMGHQGTGCTESFSFAGWVASSSAWSGRWFGSVHGLTD